jgi:hypothetical protein
VEISQENMVCYTVLLMFVLGFSKLLQNIAVAESAKRLAQVHGVDFGRMQVKRCSLRRVFLLFLNRCLQVALQFNALLRKHSKKAALVVTNLPLVCYNLYSRCIIV